MVSEVAVKLRELRSVLAAEGLGAFRFRGTDFFAWVTGGASNVVLLAAETGVAEIVVAEEGAWVLTNPIEAPRLEAEEPLAAFAFRVAPWQDARAHDAFVRELLDGRGLASDRPLPGESALPESVYRAKRRLSSEECERYRILGRDAARAMTETLLAARPEWTENELAGAGARALWSRGIEPALTLAAGDLRLPLFRHPVPSAERLGDRAMLVFCGRRHGLFANLTRFVYFREPSEKEREDLHRVARVEAAAWRASMPRQTLSEAYGAIARAYADLGFPDAIDQHHQGGTTGYLSREVVATPRTTTVVEPKTALAWNPSLPGSKIEDTVIADNESLEILTVDERWPTFEIEGRLRPELLVRP